MIAYEVLLMLDVDLAEARQDEVLVRMREQVEKSGGSWLRHEPWGRRRLAYEIGHKGEGIYHLVEFDCTPEALDEMSRVLKITDGVMRHMAVRRVEGGQRTPPPEPERPAAVGASGYDGNTRSEEEEE